MRSKTDNCAFLSVCYVTQLENQCVTVYLTWLGAPALSLLIVQRYHKGLRRSERYFPYDWYCWIIPFTMQTRAVVVRKDENGQRVYELRESVRSAGENWHCYSYVMFWDRSRSTESELQMSKIWSDLCIFIGSYPWSTAEQTHRLRHHHHSISLCILKKNSMVLCSAIDQRIRQIEMSQNISNILCWIL